MKTRLASLSIISSIKYHVYAVVRLNHKRIGNLALPRMAIGSQRLRSIFCKTNSNFPKALATFVLDVKSSSADKFGIYWETKVNAYLELLH